MQQIQQVKESLVGDKIAKMQAIDEVRSDFIKQVDSIVDTFKQDVRRKETDNLRIIGQFEEQLRDGLDTINSGCVEITNVLESGSDSDVIDLNTTPILQLVESQPSKIDTKLGQIQLTLLTLPQGTTAHLPTLEQLLCDKLHINVPSNKQDKVDPKHSADNDETRPKATPQKSQKRSINLLRRRRKPFNKSTTMSSPFGNEEGNNTSRKTP